MSVEIDYESDVLKFKQVWENNNESKIKQNSNKSMNKNKDQPDPKNLQTIQSNTKRRSNSRQKKQQNCTRKLNQQIKEKQKQNSKRDNKNVSKTVYSSSTMKNHQQNQYPQQNNQFLRNPQPQKPEQIIEVATYPKYTTHLQNQKSNIVQSYIALNNDNNDYHNQTSASTTKNKLYPSHMNDYELKKQLSQKDYQLSLLRISNSKNQDKIKYLESEVQKRDQIIQQMKVKQRRFIAKNCELESKQFNFDYGKVQYENYKNDSKRLLKMLQNTQEYMTFAELAIEDNGVRFLQQANKSHKTKLDNLKSQKGSSMIHFCTCNKAFIPQSSLWVPEKIYSFGRQFIQSRQGEPMSQSELELMLYEVNKIWRQREKRIINTLTASKGHEVSKYKRKLQNLSHISRDKHKKHSVIETHVRVASNDSSEGVIEE